MWCSESENPADETGRQEFSRSRAIQTARILDGFPTDEPENREQPVCPAVIGRRGPRRSHSGRQPAADHLTCAAMVRAHSIASACVVSTSRA